MIWYLVTWQMDADAVVSSIGAHFYVDAEDEGRAAVTAARAGELPRTRLVVSEAKSIPSAACAGWRRKWLLDDDIDYLDRRGELVQPGSDRA